MTDALRFDDRLATVLARVPERPGARAAQWRQLLDLLAQRRGGGDTATARAAAERLAMLAAEVPVAVRREAVAAIAPMRPPLALVVVLAGDVPAVSGALLSRLTLDEGDWLALLPRLGPTGRGFLRHRRDLGGAVGLGLAAFGAIDLVLPRGDAGVEPLSSPAVEPATPPDDDDPDAGPAGAPPFRPAPGRAQIRSLIRRIARFRDERDDGDAEDPAEPSVRLMFETDADGIVRVVDGAPRGPLVGETIARAGGSGGGFDAVAAGAFARRAPFREARLAIVGEGATAGEWRTSAVPVFAAGGRFLGYRGVGVRVGPATAVAETSARGDTLRQVVHELRTPLNAIGGFAEMIRRQLRGPVAGRYRDRAGEIAEQAGRLLTVIEDLDVAARLDARRLELRPQPVAVRALLAVVREEHAASAASRGVAVALECPGDTASVTGDATAIRGVVERLVAAAVAVAATGETVTVSARDETAAVTVAVSLPARLAGMTAERLFDPAHAATDEGDAVPLLGLGFSLNLARRLAGATGARLTADATRFVLRLPVADAGRDADAG